MTIQPFISKQGFSGNWVKAPEKLVSNRAFSIVENDSANESKKADDIISKFQSGQYLSPSELEYIKQKRPDMYEKISRILEERKALEQQLKSARSKKEAAMIMTFTMSMVEKTSMDDFGKTARFNHFSRAYTDYLNGKDPTKEREKHISPVSTIKHATSSATFNAKI